MAKTKKKRNKSYHGSDAAAPERPVIHRYEAVQRSSFGQWRFERRRQIKVVGIAVAVIVAIILIVTGLLSVLR